MDVNPKIIKLVVSLFVIFLIFFNIMQIINGKDIILNILGIGLCLGGYYAYDKFAKNKDKEDQF